MKERLIQLPKFADARGWSLNDIYSCVGIEPHKALDYQINYSILYPGVIKAWHRHKHQDDYFCILKGMAQVGIVNDEGATKYFIGEHNPAVVHVKAGEWHGLTCVGNFSRSYSFRMDSIRRIHRRNRNTECRRYSQEPNVPS